MELFAIKRECCLEDQQLFFIYEEPSKLESFLRIPLKEKFYGQIIYIFVNIFKIN